MIKDTDLYFKVIAEIHYYLSENKLLIKAYNSDAKIEFSSWVKIVDDPNITKRIEYSIKNKKVNLKFKSSSYNILIAEFVYGIDRDEELLYSIELLSDDKNSMLGYIKNQEINLLKRKYEELEKENIALKKEIDNLKNIDNYN